MQWTTTKLFCPAGLPPLAGRSGGKKAKRGGGSSPTEPRWQVLPQEPAAGVPALGSVAEIAAAALHTPAALPLGMTIGPMQQMLLDGSTGGDTQMSEASAPLAMQSMKALSLEPSLSGSISPFANAPAAQTSSEESDTESDEKQVLPPFAHYLVHDQVQHVSLETGCPLQTRKGRWSAHSNAAPIGPLLWDKPE